MVLVKFDFCPIIAILVKIEISFKNRNFDQTGNFVQNRNFLKNIILIKIESLVKFCLVKWKFGSDLKFCSKSRYSSNNQNFAQK